MREGALSQSSKIGWTQSTWNVLLGCSKVSPGCRDCYAMREVYRMAANPNPTIKAANEGLTVLNSKDRQATWTGKVRFLPERLSIPMKRTVPTIYFVNSLSDMFHDDVSDADILTVFQAMGKCPRHTFQILTKRAKRMPQILGPRRWRNLGHSPAMGGDHHVAISPGERIFDDSAFIPDAKFLPNVWLGVSVESRQFLPRIDELRTTPAAIRFLSIEPLLEDMGKLDLSGIDWVILGGESSHRARPLHPDWVRSVRDQCVAARVPFFFKQWGSYVPFAEVCGGPVSVRKMSRDTTLRPKWLGDWWDGKTHQIGHFGNIAKHRRSDGSPMEYCFVGKKIAGRILDGRTWDEMPAGFTYPKQQELA